MMNEYAKTREIRGDFFVLLHFQTIIIMASIKDIINSTSYKAFMKKLLVYALIAFGIGLIFLLCKLPGGEIITMTGGSTLFFWMVFFVIGIITKNNS